MTSVTARITAIGTYVPDKRLTNLDLEQMVDTNDEWIVRRTGIRERRIATEQQFTSDLCVAAIARMQERYNVDLQTVDLIIVATQTPDYGFPSTAATLQHRLNIQQSVTAFDLSAACAGFTYGVYLASKLIESGAHRRALVFGADTMSKITDYTDRSTCILFGDGAGVVMLEASEEREPLLLASHFSTDGSGGIHVYKSGLSDHMNDQSLVNNGRIVQNGREVYRWAVTEVSSGIGHLLQAADKSISDISWFVPHSANMRMIESICERSGLPLDRTLTSMEWYGNTSAASIPLALTTAIRDGRLRAGQTILMYGFGAGLVACGLIIRL